jgi:hypothetical protein
LTGKLSPRQLVVFDELGEAGFPVHIIRSKEDVEDFILEATRGQSFFNDDEDMIDDTGGAV